MNKTYLFAGVLVGFLLSLGSVAYAAFAPISTPAGGTGTSTAPWASDQFLISTTSGKGYDIKQLIAGTNITIATSSGKVTISSSASGGGSGTVGTSTVPTISQLSYWTGNGTPSLLGSIATTTLGFSGPFTGYGSIGTLVGGSNTTLTWTGLATTSQPSSSNLLTSNGGAGVYGTATSTLSATTPLTGSFTQVGSGGSLSCQTASGSQAGCLSSTDWSTFNGKLGSYDAWTHALAGVSATTSLIGIGTTTPFSQLSVSTSTAGLSGNTSLFAVASSTNATLFNVLGSGNVGIGTSSPSTLLTIAGTSGPIVAIDAPGNTFAQYEVRKAGTVFGRMQVAGNSNDFAIRATNASGNLILGAGGTGNNYATLTAGGNLGVGTSTPWGTLSVSTSAQQAAATPLFVIASTTNATLFNVLGNGNVGVGSSSPQYPFSLGSATSPLKAWFAGTNFHFGTTTCPVSNEGYGGVGVEICNEDNSAGGVNLVLANRNAGTAAFSDLLFGNDASIGNPNAFAVLNFNSYGYVQGAYGALASYAHGFSLQNGEGNIAIFTSTTTGSTLDKSIIFGAGGSGTANEVLRITPTGVGIGTTTPHAILAISSTAASSGNAFEIADGNGSATSTIFTVASSSAATLGIGTSTPSATVAIQTGASTGNAFVVATSSSAQIGGWDNDGHRFSSGPPPAVSTCGTGSPSVVGDDTGGAITTGTAATACTLTFAKAYRATPYCTETDNSATIPGSISTLNTTTLTFALGAGLSGGTIYYSCGYHQ